MFKIALYNQSSVMNIRIAHTGIVDYILLICVAIACVSIAVRGSGRIRYNDVMLDKEQRKRAEALG